MSRRIFLLVGLALIVCGPVLDALGVVVDGRPIFLLGICAAGVWGSILLWAELNRFGRP